jgi:hypothetical protein
MKLFWQKILPLSLPLLMLAVVLSSCGKNSLSDAPLSKQARTSAVRTQAQTANGAVIPGDLNSSAFTDKCAAKQGIMKNHDTVCIAPLAEGTLDASKEGDTAVTVQGGILTGDLITSAYSGDAHLAEIQLEHRTFMSFGESKAADINGELSIYVKQSTGAPGAGTGTVKVWRCYNRHVNPSNNPTQELDRVYCNGISL